MDKPTEIQCQRKLSYWQLAMHMFFIITIEWIALHILPWPYLILLAVIFSLAMYYHLKKQRHMLACAMLEHHTWTFLYEDDCVERYNVTQIIDHHLYFVFYFETGIFARSQVIWKDQLSACDYRKMKVYAKLY